MAQQPAPVVSPEVAPDGSVTFRLRAPNAQKVEVRGDWGEAVAMTKGTDGVWSATTGALKPDIYSYSFRVDEASISDPGNNHLKPGLYGTQSLLTVPSSEPQPWSLTDVPHGVVHHHFYKSGPIGDQRSFVVYTPPGYEQNRNARYPVLYLSHGSGDWQTGWVEVGKANFILDNLIAQGKAKPMLVVMPFGQTLPGSPRQQRNVAKFLDLYAKDLFNEIVPAVEQMYHVAAGSENRAIAGLSMGGGQALWTGLNHASKFGFVAGFSSWIPLERGDNFEGMLARFDPARKDNPKLWIAIGEKDFLLDNNEKLHAWLQSKNVQHSYRVTEGAHTWRVWRRYLAELVPLLFRS
jgi:enterochelin esterase family protein